MLTVKHVLSSACAKFCIEVYQRQDLDPPSAKADDYGLKCYLLQACNCCRSVTDRCLYKTVQKLAPTQHKLITGFALPWAHNNELSTRCFVIKVTPCSSMGRQANCMQGLIAAVLGQKNQA